MQQMLIENIKEKSQSNPVHAIVLALIFLLTVTLFAMIAVIFHSTNQANDEARSHSISSANNILKEKLLQLESNVSDYSYWDDLIQNTYYRHDQKWIDNKLGKYLLNNFNISNVIVLDGKNKPIVAISNGVTVDKNFYHTFVSDLKELAEKAREPSPTRQGTSRISIFNNTPILLAASVLTPEDGSQLPSPAPVLIYGKQLNNSFLSKLSKQFQLDELQFTQTGKADSSQAFIDIKNRKNQSIGKLTWSPKKPGDQVLTKTKRPMIFLLLGCTLVLFIIIRSTNIITKRLANAKESIEFLSTAIDQSQSIVLIFDHEGTIKYTNLQADNFFNISFQDKNIANLIPTLFNDKFYRIINNHIINKNLWQGDFEYKSSDSHSI
ncbi:CHASE4 domain-containing protein [Neptunomonas sp.]|uniref:CHASE4 domain-containing protein n=1 Tax=Neptunomonas sp. TaxID=1971898 RepID=UPI0025F6D5E6|nr:CHASE4 domain-containing protein [Neptunomonas sp.]